MPNRYKDIVGLKSIIITLSAGTSVIISGKQAVASTQNELKRQPALSFLKTLRCVRLILIHTFLGKRKSLKRFAVIVLSVLYVVSIMSCAPVSDGALSTTVPTYSDSIETLPPPSGCRASTELRAAIRLESNMNPLYPKHYATRSLLALVYEPLFKVDHEGKIIPVLANSVSYDVATTTYRIQIDNQKTFHSGKKLTVQDVKASLLKTISLMTENLPPTEDGNDGKSLTAENYATSEKQPAAKLDTGSLSASYKDGSVFQAEPFSFMTAAKKNEYRNIRLVSTEGLDTLILELKNHDPHILDLLTFPIIPESHINDLSMNPISGSGAWKVISTEDGRLVKLERVSPGTGIRHISAKAFDSAALAMEAFDKGDIDVLVLDVSETSLFADRTRIRKQRIDYPGYISLFFRGSNHESALLWRNYMLREIKSDSKGDFFAAPFACAFYPLLPGDFRQQHAVIPEYQIGDLPALELPENEQETTGTTDDAGAPSPTIPDTREPFVLLLPEGFTPYRLVENIGACVARLGRRFIPVHVAKEAWAEKLRKGSYDAALLVDVSLTFLDPVDYLEGLQHAKLFDWTEYVAPDDVIALREVQHLVSSFGDERQDTFSGSAYAQSISRTFSILPVLGLAIPETMVLYGCDVENTMAGIWHSPYDNVEELVVWSP